MIHNSSLSVFDNDTHNIHLIWIQYWVITQYMRIVFKSNVYFVYHYWRLKDNLHRFFLQGNNLLISVYSQVPFIPYLCLCSLFTGNSWKCSFDWAYKNTFSLHIPTPLVDKKFAAQANDPTRLENICCLISDHTAHSMLILSKSLYTGINSNKLYVNYLKCLMIIV